MDTPPYDFSPFNIIDDVYKHVEGHAIGVSILTPKDITPGKYPVVVRFHGGFLVTGSRSFSDWFPNWFGDYASKTHCIIVNADYRLLPEASGRDILDDVSDLWAWIRDSLATTLAPLNVEPDLSKIITLGESAGGYLAVQAALLHPEMNVKAVISVYGMLDLKHRFFTEEYEKIILGAPMMPRDLLDTQLADVKSGKEPKIVTAADPPARIPLSLSIVQYGQFLGVFGEQTELFPFENLDRVKSVPPIWLMHGKEDTAVPVEASIAFADKVKKLFPSNEVLLTLKPGEHGFDGYAKVEDDWVQKGLQFIEKNWLDTKSTL